MGRSLKKGGGWGARCLEAVATGLLCLGECSIIISSRRFTFSSLPAEDRNVCFLNSCALFPRGGGIHSVSEICEEAHAFFENSSIDLFLILKITFLRVCWVHYLKILK